MSGPSRLHQGGSEFASTVTGHNVDLGNKSLTRRDTAQTINNHNYYGYSTVQLRDQAHENRGEKRKCPDDQEQGSHSQPSIEALLQSLRFNQIDARHDNIKKAHRKTCKWIIKRAEYLDWLNPNKVDEHHGFLWIKGKPGAGKSTLMKFILSNARRSMKDRIIISFFFNARGEQLEKSTTGMYRSLLLQILQQLPTLHSALDPALVLGIGENHEWKIEALRALFEQTVENLGSFSVVVFIDALDECDESEIRAMVSSFKSLGDLSAAEGISFQVCLASRHYPHITMPKKIELVLEGQEGHEQDIISYLDSELEIGDSKLAQEVRSQIKEKASGVFMWVVLVAGILQQKYDQGRIHTLKQTLREIPGDLHELFRDILTRDDVNKDELLLCIQWVLFARNPLKPEQLYFAIRSHVECSICKWDRDEIGEVAIGNFILSSSKGLAEVTRVKKDPTVQFIHESVRDFLLKENGLRVILETGGDIGAESHDQLKRCCYKYTQSYTEENGLPKSDSKDHLSEARVVADLKFPFLRYAVQNVLYHANVAEEGHISQTKFLESFQLARWIQHNNVFQDKDVRRHTTGASLLYLLAEYSFGSLIESHQQNQSCFDIEGERYGAPILAAMATGNRPTVWRLLKREIREEPATSRLHSLCNEYDVEKKVKHGLGRNFKFKPQLGLLYYLLHEDDLIAASVAIASSKPYTHLDFRTSRGEKPFSVASQHSHDISVPFRFLVENGADIEDRDELRRTPLCLAAANGNTAAVGLLLEKGANTENTCSGGKTPIMYAAAEGTEECMRLLLSGGASVAVTDNRLQTALFRAVCSQIESEAKVHLLIGQGADVSATDNNGYTALTWSLKQGKATRSIVQMLLSHGDTVKRTDFLGRTPLMLALNSHLSVTKQLIVEGADINAIDTEGQSALLLGVRFMPEGHARSADFVSLFLSHGADVHRADNCGRTPLSYAVAYSYKASELLLNHGADVHHADNSGRTPLSYAVVHDYKASELLLNHGADVHHADNSGRTPLSYAVVYSYKASELLLNHGADVHHADNSGRTPLSYAVARNYKATKLLLDHGADVNAVDNHGWTLLLLNRVCD